MVECFDRIHLKVTELALQPLKALREDASLTEVTTSPPGRGPRVYVTVSKTWPDGPDRPPSYHWSARQEAGSSGQTWAGEERHDTPEAAYWSALDTVAAARTAVNPNSESVEESLSDASRPV